MATLDSFITEELMEWEGNIVTFDKRKYLFSYPHPPGNPLEFSWLGKLLQREKLLQQIACLEKLSWTNKNNTCSYSNYIKNHKVYYSEYFRARVFTWGGLEIIFLLFLLILQQRITQWAVPLLSTFFFVLFWVIRYHSVA